MMNDIPKKSRCLRDLRKILPAHRSAASALGAGSRGVYAGGARAAHERQALKMQAGEHIYG